MKASRNKSPAPPQRKHKDIGKKIEALKDKLKEIAAKKQAKQPKKDPVTAQIMKLRRQLIQAVEVFESDKDRIPLEILSLSKRLVFSINQYEEQLALEREAAENDGKSEGEKPVDITF